MTPSDDAGLGATTCREFVDLVTEYLENRLDTSDRLRFEHHVDACPGCARYLEQIRESMRLLGYVTLDTLAPDARDQLMEAFRNWRSGRFGVG